MSINELGFKGVLAIAGLNMSEILDTNNNPYEVCYMGESTNYIIKLKEINNNEFEVSIEDGEGSILRKKLFQSNIIDLLVSDELHGFLVNVIFDFPQVKFIDGKPVKTLNSDDNTIRKLSILGLLSKFDLKFEKSDVTFEERSLYVEIANPHFKGRIEFTLGYDYITVAFIKEKYKLVRDFVGNPDEIIKSESFNTLLLKEIVETFNHLDVTKDSTIIKLFQYCLESRVKYQTYVYNYDQVFVINTENYYNFILIAKKLNVIKSFDIKDNKLYIYTNLLEEVQQEK